MSVQSYYVDIIYSDRLVQYNSKCNEISLYLYQCKEHFPALGRPDTTRVATPMVQAPLKTGKILSHLTWNCLNHARFKDRYNALLRYSSRRCVSCQFCHYRRRSVLQFHRCCLSPHHHFIIISSTWSSYTDVWYAHSSVALSRSAGTSTGCVHDRQPWWCQHVLSLYGRRHKTISATPRGTASTTDGTRWSDIRKGEVSVYTGETRRWPAVNAGLSGQAVIERSCYCEAQNWPKRDRSSSSELGSVSDERGVDQGRLGCVWDAVLQCVHAVVICHTNAATGAWTGHRRRWMDRATVNRLSWRHYWHVTSLELVSAVDGRS